MVYSLSNFDAKIYLRSIKGQSENLGFCSDIREVFDFIDTPSLTFTAN